MSNPRNDLEALTMGLYLAMTAPSEAKHVECMAMVEGLWSRMSSIEVARAREYAEARVEQERSG
jgi:hypothetical protein